MKETGSGAFWPELSEDEWLARLDADSTLVLAIRSGNFTLLHYAASCGLVRLASILLERGANPDTLDDEGQWPLRAAIERGHSEVVRLLLKHRAHPTRPSLSQRYQGERRIICDTALTVASMHASLEVVRLLVEAGADLNREDVDGWTPLHAAVYGDRVEVVQYLLDNRADTTISMRYGCTAAETADNKAAAIVRKHQEQQNTPNR